MVKVTVKDREGKVVATFDANKEESLASQAQDAGAPVPVSCGVGACRTCVCKIKKGAEYINREAVGPQHIDTEEDEVLTCVAGLADNIPDDAEIELEAENL